jgi:hypothetical protein
VAFPTAQNYYENFKVYRIEGRTKVMGERGRRRKKLQDYLKDMRG